MWSQEGRQILQKVPEDTTDGEGISFQPAIVAPRLDLIGCDIAPSAKMIKRDEVQIQDQNDIASR